MGDVAKMVEGAPPTIYAGPHRCPRCDATFTSRRKLKAHLGYRHGRKLNGKPMGKRS